MQGLNKKIAILLGLLVAIFVINKPVAAATANEQTRPEFSVASVRNEYQTDDVGYFDLSGLQPGQKTKLKLRLTNTGNKSATFDVSANNASTNENLILDYTGQLKESQKISGLQFSKLAQPEKKVVTLAANSSLLVNVDVTMPQQHFDGQIVGGIYLKKHDSLAEEAREIKNSFAYANTVILRQGKQELAAQPKLLSAGYSIRNFVPTVIGKIENDIQAYASQVEVTRSITDSKNKVIKTVNDRQRAIAPKASTEIYVQLDENLKPGKYYLNTSYKINGETLKSSQPFTVSPASAAGAVVGKINHLLWLIIILIVLLILLAISLFILIWKRRKRRDEEADKEILS